MMPFHIAEILTVDGTLIFVADVEGAYPSVINGDPGFNWQLLSNPEFTGGSLTGYGVYDNAASGKVTHTAVADGTAPNATGWKLQIATAAGTPAPAPGLGGFFRNIPVDSGIYAQNTYHKGNKIMWQIRANIPVGYQINWASNATGDNSTLFWLTSQAGTGGWFEYVAVQTIGTTGTFSTTGFFYLTGTAPVTWAVARCAAITDACTAHNPWLMQAGPFKRYRDSRTDAGDLILQNVSGNTIGRDVAGSITSHEFEGAMAIVRLFEPITQTVIDRWDCTLTDQTGDDNQITFRAVQLMDANQYTVANDIYNDRCTLRYKESRCASVSGLTTCTKLLSACVTRGVQERFNATPNPPPFALYPAPVNDGNTNAVPDRPPVRRPPMPGIPVVNLA